MNSAEDGRSPALMYALVVVCEVLSIAALWLLGRMFG
jgi:hypothetical protein